MKQFVATFHTHLSALMTCRSMESAGLQARMVPVPRVLSSSCGTCVFYSADDVCRELLDEDTEAVYLSEDGNYTVVLELE